MIALLFLLPTYWPLVLLLLPMALVALWLPRRAERRRRSQLGARTHAVIGSPRWPLLRASCDALALLLVLVALLQPVGVGEQGDGGADVVLCVDVSWSMAARDELPSRLQRVQEEMGELATGLTDTRLALVAFAGTAELVVPLTVDAAAVVTMANELLPGAHGTGGTDPGAAIDLARQWLARSERLRVIVVLSDGEDFVGNGMAAAARTKTAGIVVHAVGCGDPGGSKIVVDGDGGEQFLRDGSGNDIVSRLEVANLQALSHAGGGRFTRSTPNSLRRLYDEHVVPAARAAAVHSGRLAPRHLAPWVLFTALCLWMLRWCVPERSR